MNGHTAQQWRIDAGHIFQQQGQGQHREMVLQGQIGKTFLHRMGRFAQTFSAQAGPLGRPSAARGEGNLAGSRRQSRRIDHAAHPGQTLPAASNGKTQVQGTNTLRLIGQQRIGRRLLKRVQQLFGMKKGRQRQMRNSGILAGKIQQHPGRAVIGENGKHPTTGKSFTQPGQLALDFLA